MAWEAIAVDGNSQCRARLSTNRHGKHLFELERRGPGGQFRTSRSDGLAGDSLKAVFPHAGNVLQRVATEGR